MMQESVRKMIQCREDSALLLVDIGAWPFHDLLEQIPQRAKNIGIFEPGTISIAAGLSLMGITPTVYGISPFIVQRGLEQLKLDFVYQKTGGNFITTGASYDFSTLGYSHYCPEDVATLYQLPDLDILTPATPGQFQSLWNSCAYNGRPSYFRMTDHCAEAEVDVVYGRAAVLKRGTKGLVIAAAEMLDTAIAACSDQDVTLLYYTTMQPFDAETLRAAYHPNIFVCEPFYKGTMVPQITNALHGMSIRLDGSGIPRAVLRSYGTKAEKDQYCELTTAQVARKLHQFLGQV